MSRSSHSTPSRTSIAAWISAALLLLAVIGMQPALAQLRQRFTKHPMPIKLPLEQFDFRALPSFIPITQPRKVMYLDQEIETEEKFGVMLARRTPAASGMRPEVILHFAYYNDPRHQVAHTPEVCFRQDGGIINGLYDTRIQTSTLAPEHPDIPVRVVDVQRTPTTRIIDLYTFVSNGAFYADRNQLRLALGVPGDRFVYFCKIEVMVTRDDAITDAEARECAEQLLREAIPILQKNHLATRNEVRGR